MYACMYVCMYVCMYACMYVCIVCMYVCMHVCMYCMYCMYVCMYDSLVCTSTGVNIQTRLHSQWVFQAFQISKFKIFKFNLEILQIGIECIVVCKHQCTKCIGNVLGYRHATVQ